MCPSIRSCIFISAFISFVLALTVSSTQVKKISMHIQKSIGDGVSRDAQQLFNLLSKALPCSWAHHTIVVGTPGADDEVCIAPPYTMQTCTGKVCVAFVSTFAMFSTDDSVIHRLNIHSIGWFKFCSLLASASKL